MPGEWKSAEYRAGAHPSPKIPSFGDLMPAALLAGVGMVGLVVMTVSGTDRDAQGQYLVVGPPTFSRDLVLSTIYRAGGALMEVGAAPNIAFAWSEDADFPAAARAAGAWFVLGAAGFAGCLAYSAEDPR